MYIYIFELVSEFLRGFMVGDVVDVEDDTRSSLWMRTERVVTGGVDVGCTRNEDITNVQTHGIEMQPLYV